MDTATVEAITKVIAALAALASAVGLGRLSTRERDPYQALRTALELRAKFAAESPGGRLLDRAILEEMMCIAGPHRRYVTQVRRAALTLVILCEAIALAAMAIDIAFLGHDSPGHAYAGLVSVAFAVLTVVYIWRERRLGRRVKRLPMLITADDADEAAGASDLGVIPAGSDPAWAPV